jgi:hypothetical protein
MNERQDAADNTASELTTETQVEGGARTGNPDAGPVTGSPSDIERDAGNTDVHTAAARSAGAAAQGGAVPNTTTNPKQGAEPAYTVDDVRAADFAKIEAGWSVLASDGEQLGDVSEKGPAWLAVPYGAERERTMYIPMHYVETAVNRRVILNQPAGLLIDMKLDAPPAEFPSDYERVSGTEHEPLRGEPAAPAVIETPDMPAQAEGPPSAGRSTGQMSSEGGSPSGSGDVRSVGSASLPLEGSGQTLATGVDQAERLPELRAADIDPALLPAEPWQDQSGSREQVEPTVSGRDVARRSAPQASAARYNEVSTRMDASVAGDGTTAWDRVNAQDTFGRTFAERSGYTVLTSETHYGGNDGPTSQAGVMPGREHKPLRSQIGTVGTPGEGKERYVSDLDLTKNRHPESGAFDSQEATIGRPLAPGERTVANRSIQRSAGRPVPPQARPHDVPPGSVSRPASEDPSTH